MPLAHEYLMPSKCAYLEKGGNSKSNVIYTWKKIFSISNNLRKKKINKIKMKFDTKIQLWELAKFTFWHLPKGQHPPKLLTAAIVFVWRHLLAQGNLARKWHRLDGMEEWISVGHFSAGHSTEILQPFLTLPPLSLLPISHHAIFLF